MRLKKHITDLDVENAIVSAELIGAPDFINEDGKVEVYALATYLIEKRNAQTIRGTKREIFIYESGIYIEGEDKLKKDIRTLLKSACTNYHIREVVEMIKDRTSIDREAFATDINLINLNNGVLDISTHEFTPHDSRHLFFTKIPVDFDANADCPTIKKYLSDVLDPAQILVIQEWFGYALYREYFIKKALICVGEGDTGKTTLINLLFEFIGAKNISGVSLQKITYDKFAAAHLYNKSLNLYDDLSFKDIQDNGAFKIATGGGVITGEKKFKDQFLFKNYAKLTFACNKIPDVKDASDDAYFNRWMVIHFDHVIEEENKDRQLIHKMTTTGELSGLLNFALDGLKRLRIMQRFSYDRETHEIKTEMMRSASSIACFAGDRMEEVTGEWISKEDLYHAYTEYASIHKQPAVSMKTFGGRLAMHAPYVAEYKPIDPNDPKGKKQITAWRNVKLKVEDLALSTS